MPLDAVVEVVARLVRIEDREPVDVGDAARRFGLAGQSVLPAEFAYRKVMNGPDGGACEHHFA